MNVFLPYSDYRKSVECLDRQRLGKQRSEVKAVFVMCCDPGFRNQPLVKMWKPHLWWLLEYGILCCEEWASRGYEDNLGPWMADVQKYQEKGEMPTWPEEYHSSVRANLLRKDHKYYSKYGWTELPGEGYDWPA